MGKKRKLLTPKQDWKRWIMGPLAIKAEHECWAFKRNGEDSGELGRNQRVWNTTEAKEIDSSKREGMFPSGNCCQRFKSEECLSMSLRCQCVSIMDDIFSGTMRPDTTLHCVEECANADTECRQLQGNVVFHRKGKYVRGPSFVGV